MKWWRSWAYIKVWYKLTQEQRHTLRLMDRRKRFRWWEQQREAYRWARIRDYILATIVLIVIPLTIILTIIHLIGKGIGFNG